MYHPSEENDEAVLVRPTKRYFGFKPTALTVFAFLSLAAAAGCSDALAPAARGLRVPPVVRDVQPLAPVSKSLPVTPLSKVILASYPFFEGVLVEGRIQGPSPFLVTLKLAACRQIMLPSITWVSGLIVTAGNALGARASAPLKEPPPVYLLAREGQTTRATQAIWNGGIQSSSAE